MMPAREIAAAAKLTTPTDREIRIERIFNAPRDHVSLFHTSQERDGMMSSGMEQGLNQSYAALDALLARPS